MWEIDSAQVIDSCKKAEAGCVERPNAQTRDLHLKALDGKEQFKLKRLTSSLDAEIASFFENGERTTTDPDDVREAIRCTAGLKVVRTTSSATMQEMSRLKTP